MPVTINIMSYSSINSASFLLSVRVELLFDIRTQEYKAATPPTFDVVHVLVVAVAVL